MLQLCSSIRARENRSTKGGSSRWGDEDVQRLNLGRSESFKFWVETEMGRAGTVRVQVRNRLRSDIVTSECYWCR